MIDSTLIMRMKPYIPTTTFLLTIHGVDGVNEAEMARSSNTMDMDGSEHKGELF